MTDCNHSLERVTVLAVGMSLCKHHKRILERYRPELVEEIDPDSLFPQLRKYSLVTSRQEDTIKDQQVQKVLVLLKRNINMVDKEEIHVRPTVIGQDA
ncbi:hypothetical protein LSAT2_028354 [Lamellibrachia satsuma]|nr:hypothetical protein LSAT2_028354 [Lamellibrachia satsuma]